MVAVYYIALFDLYFFVQHDNDWVLLVIVAVVVTVDLFIMFIGTVAPTSRLNATLVDDIQHPHIFIVSKRMYKLSKSIVIVKITMHTSDYHRLKGELLKMLYTPVSVLALLYGWPSHMPTRASFNWWQCSWPSTFAKQI